MFQNKLLFDEQEAVEFLQSLGYRVIKEPTKDKSHLSTTRDLVSYFYAMRRFYHPERKFPESINYSKDQKLISRLVELRKRTGLSRKNAVRESAEIIEALFRYEDLLNLDYPVYGPELLTNSGFVDRLCSLLNGDVPEAGELDTERFVCDHNDYYGKHFSLEDQSRADQIRKNILKGLEEE